MKALIYEDRICQLEEREFPVSEPLTWVDVPEGTTTLDAYKDGEVVKYVPGPEPEQLPTDIERIEALENAMSALLLQ